MAQQLDMVNTKALARMAVRVVDLEERVAKLEIVK
jgi:hypothetical protein